MIQQSVEDLKSSMHPKSWLQKSACLAFAARKILAKKTEKIFKILICMNMFYFYQNYYHIKANEEIQKRKRIPETQKCEQLPRRSKKYIFGFLPILPKNLVLLTFWKNPFCINFRNFLAGPLSKFWVILGQWGLCWIHFAPPKKKNLLHCGQFSRRFFGTLGRPLLELSHSQNLAWWAGRGVVRRPGSPEKCREKGPGFDFRRGASVYHILKIKIENEDEDDKI